MTKSESSNNKNLSTGNDLGKTISRVLTLVTQANHQEVVGETLDILLKEFQSDRIFIGDLDKEKNNVNYFFTRKKENASPITEELIDLLKKGSLPWWAKSLKLGKEVIISNTLDMPEEAEQEKGIFPASQIKSTLAVPTYYGGVINGFIGLDHVNEQYTWTNKDVELLRMYAHIISITIEHARLENEIASSKKEVINSDRKFQIIFDELSTGVILLDAEGLIVDINQSGIEMFGTTREELIGLEMMNCPALPEELIASMAPENASEEYNDTFAYDFDLIRETNFYKTSFVGVRYLRIKGMTLLDDNNEILGFIAIMIDDTDDYLKNEMIQANLAKLKVAIDTGESLIWEYDTQSGFFNIEFTAEDSKSEHILYLKTNKINSIDEFHSTVYKEDQEYFFSQFQQLLQGKIDNYTISYRCSLEDRIFWFHSNIRTYKYNEDGTPHKIIGYTINTTELREQELELVKVKEADKLKSAFMANMSHEIRTPLNAIVGFSNLLAEQNKSEDNIELADLINKNNEILLNIVHDVLDFSKMESGSFDYYKTDTDIKEICQEAITPYLSRSDNQVRFIFNDSLPSVKLYTDKNRILKVINHFLSNAYKFTKKGSVTLSYEITTDQFVRVSVTDTGIGMAEEDQKHIFDKFFKVDTFQQGVGLGMPISKNIVEALGGEIGLYSKEGQGSTFWFTLPVNEN